MAADPKIIINIDFSDIERRFVEYVTNHPDVQKIIAEGEARRKVYEDFIKELEQAEKNENGAK